MYHTLHFSDIPDYSVNFYHSLKNAEAARVWPPHVHDGVELYVLEEGSVSFAVEERKYTLTRGDAVFARPGEIHNCILETAGAHCHFCLWFDSALFDTLSKLRGFSGERLISLPISEKEELLRTLYALVDAKEKDESFLAYAAVTRILSLLGQGKDEKKEKEIPQQLKELLKDVEKGEELGKIAEAHFISQSTLYRLFREYLGVSPHVYVKKKRLEKARELLRHGESVSAAAIQAGFADYSSFIRIFRQSFGITPAAYRRLARDGSDTRLYVDIRSGED